jgi:hypothetical protein
MAENNLMPPPQQPALEAPAQGKDDQQQQQLQQQQLQQQQLQQQQLQQQQQQQLQQQQQQQQLQLPQQQLLLQQQQQQQQLVAPVNQPVNQVPIVHAQVVPNADGGMAVKVQQSKLPEFWGQKDKDSITANKFVKWVDKMASANGWSDKIAFDNFGLALRGSANTWLDTQVILKRISGDRE